MIKGAILLMILSIAMMATTSVAQPHHHLRPSFPLPRPLPRPRLPPFRCRIPFIPGLPQPHVQPPQPSPACAQTPLEQPSPSPSPDAAPETPVVPSPPVGTGDAQSHCYAALHDNRIASCIQDIINSRFNRHFSVSSECCSLLTTCQAVVRRNLFMDQLVSTYCN